MPTKSLAQKRLMQAAAHTKGGFGGVPQKVGKEFIKSKKMAEGGMASLGGMTSSTPSVPAQQQPMMAQGGSQSNLPSAPQMPMGPDGSPVSTVGYKKGGQVTTRRVSTGSTSKKSSNW